MDTHGMHVLCRYLVVRLNLNEQNLSRYDRQRLVLKEIHNCQYITCMNPTAGSFSVNPRLQVQTCIYTDMYSTYQIYITIINVALATNI